MNKIIKAFIFFILISTACYSQTEVVGEVSGVWAVDGSPYIVTDNITLPEGEALRIEPGVEVRFQWRPVYIMFQVFGDLTAIGTAEDSIFFTSNAEQPGTGDWRGIYLDGGSLDFAYVGLSYFFGGIRGETDGEMNISNCRFTDYDFRIDPEGGMVAGIPCAIGIDGLQGMISNCIVNGGDNIPHRAITVGRRAENILIEDCLLSNFSNLAIRMYPPIDENNRLIAEVMNCEIINCPSGLWFESNGDLSVINNTFTDCDGGVINEGQGNILITGNTFVGCSRYAIKAKYMINEDNSMTIIRNNLIYNCQQGIKIDGSHRNANRAPFLIQFNTVVESGIPLLSDSRYDPIIIRNNIFANNRSEVFYSRGRENLIDQDYNLFWNNNEPVDPELSRDKYFQLCEHDLASDPMFTNENGFHPAPNSPAIDRADPGVNVGNEPEPNGDRANLGVYGTTESATQSPQEPLGAILSLYPRQLHFDLVQTGVRDFEEFFIQNAGDDASVIQSIEVSDPNNFHIDDIEPFPIQPGTRSEAIPIRFQSRNGGIFQESLIVTTDAGRLSIPLFARATDYQILRREISGLLTKEGSPYVITYDTEIPEGESLTIEAGTEILMTDFCQFRCYGDLIANGESDDTIKFTAFSPDPVAGQWGSITCESRISLSYFSIQYGRSLIVDTRAENCSIHHGLISQCSETGLFYLNRGRGQHVLHNLVIDKCQTGLSMEMEHGEPDIHHINILHNSAGCLISIREWEFAPVMENSIIAWNDEAIIYRISGDPGIIEYCNFFENQELGSAIIRNSIEEDPLFFGSPHYPYHLSPQSPCLNTGNPEFEEDEDGTRTDLGAIPTNFDNISPEIEGFQPESNLCVIAGETVTFTVIAFDEEESVLDYKWTVNDSKFWGIDSLTWTFDSLGVFDVTVRVCDGYNLTAQLEWTAQVVLGVDHEKDKKTDSFALKAIYPNPFNSTVNILYSINNFCPVNLSIYDISGRLVYNLIKETQQVGLQLHVLQSGDMPSGIYFLKVESDYKMIVSKIVIVE